MLSKSIFLISLFAEIAFSQTHSSKNAHRSFGLKPLTPQEKLNLHQQPVHFVNLNRTNKALILNLPPQVDNSNNPNFKAFPAIGDQGDESSCVSWATTYYMMSHEVCLATPGCDNQTVGSTTSRIFSPRWTYNLINDGEDNGSYFSSAFLLLKNHGAATLAQLPYKAGDYRKWDLNAQDWRAAIWSRMGELKSIPINTDSGMQLVKQTLVNGHVMVFGTYFDSWVMSAVDSNSNATTNPFAGQKIVTYLNGTDNAHAVTIVGYDDTIWTDINGNGIVEPGELGAFKIANSEGQNYGNKGFVWAAYDAFRTTSSVPEFYPANRMALSQTEEAYLSIYTPYSPKLLARANLSHRKRNQISFQFGSSSLSSSNPTSYLTLSALQNDGGHFAFDGSNTEVSATFYFDISPLLSSTWNQQKFYFITKDSTRGNPLSVTHFEIVDPETDAVLLSVKGVPATVDASTKTFATGN